MVEHEPFKEWIFVDKNCADSQPLEDWKTQLINGNYFIKHHKWGKPKLRLVWLDDKLTEISWGDPKDLVKGLKVKGMLKVSEIKELKDGLAKSKISDPRAAKRTACTFSIISGTRTLELECATVVLLLLC